MNVNKDGKKYLTGAGYSLLMSSPHEEYLFHHSNQRGVTTVRSTFNIMISFLAPSWKTVLNHVKTTCEPRLTRA